MLYEHKDTNGVGIRVALPDPEATRRRFIAILEDARINLRRVYVCWRNCHGYEAAIFGTVYMVDDHNVSVMFHDSEVCETMRIASIYAIHVLGDPETAVA